MESALKSKPFSGACKLEGNLMTKVVGSSVLSLVAGMAFTVVNIKPIEPTWPTTLVSA